MNHLDGTVEISKEPLICPITFELFDDPVMADDGHTYERRAIEEWINNNHTSPLTRQTLYIEALRPNFVVHQLVEEFKKVAVRQKYQYILNEDVRKKPNRRPVFSTAGKHIFEAEWVRLNGPPIVLLQITGAKAKKEASYYADLSHHRYIIKTYGLVLVPSNTPNNNMVTLLQELAPDRDLYNFLLDLGRTPSENILRVIFIQICEAMDYLVQNTIVHGDLACRNVLVFRFDEMEPENSFVKLTDFGLSQNSMLYASVNSSATAITTIPCRSAAPEVLRDPNSRLSYSERSDMFSMGVLMWEAYSKGEIPWSNIHDDNEIRHLVLQEKRVEQPENCQNNMWSIISKCMSQCPANRPTFAHLQRSLAPTRIRSPQPATLSRVVSYS
ncbi:unnamed protein product [Didymodactylos carnosus]|uniref:Uncharacterized protein n=1 Tax=Didymodactylos carnosus TaxID=1234261 RepID=A0A814RR96_9BILA|nr:unnamed protein product [Didymodactylos carnosus]CAF1136822.1 unnamed protein product [Didymodactylos carnosus]CAF3691511.1 unnamed protein product [Didymodactylos carnosus]CAF3900553.1 unnamed protein product [Didymodactylos carnosus]